MAKHNIRVRIDRTLCIGSGLCVAVAPGVFQLDDTSKATVLDPEATDEATLVEAAESCPTGAILLEDEAGNALSPKPL